MFQGPCRSAGPGCAPPPHSACRNSTAGVLQAPHPCSASKEESDESGATYAARLTATQHRALAPQIAGVGRHRHARTRPQFMQNSNYLVFSLVCLVTFWIYAHGISLSCFVAQWCHGGQWPWKVLAMRSSSEVRELRSEATELQKVCTIQIYSCPCFLCYDVPQCA